MLIALSTRSSVSPTSMARFDAATACSVCAATRLHQVVDVAGERRGRVPGLCDQRHRRLLLVDEPAAKLIGAVRPKAEGDQLPCGLRHGLKPARTDHIDRPLETVGGGLEAFDDRRDESGVLKVHGFCEQHADEIGLGAELRHRGIGEEGAFGEARFRRLRCGIAERAEAGHQIERRVVEKRRELLDQPAVQVGGMVDEAVQLGAERELPFDRVVELVERRRQRCARVADLGDQPAVLRCVVHAAHLLRRAA